MSNQDDKQLKNLWTKLMRYQTDFSMPLELSFYYSSEDWLNARSVMDLGTGNGYYLSRLVKRFPSKAYTAVDVDPFYIRSSRERFSDGAEYKNCTIDFEVKNVFETKGRFDFVLARLLVQHLPSPDMFLKHARSILRPGGALLIIDSHDPSRRFFPELPYVKKFFQTLRAARRKAGCDRDAASIIISRAKDHGFELAKKTKLLIPSTISSNKRLFAKSYQTAFQVVKKNYNVDFDYDALRKELRAWLDTPGSYAQIGVHMACYKRR